MNFKLKSSLYNLDTKQVEKTLAKAAEWLIMDALLEFCQTADHHIPILTGESKAVIKKVADYFGLLFESTSMPESPNMHMYDRLITSHNPARGMALTNPSKKYYRGRLTITIDHDIAQLERWEPRWDAFSSGSASFEAFLNSSDINEYIGDGLNLCFKVETS